MNVFFVGATGLVGSQTVPLLTDDFDLTLAAAENGEMAGLPVNALDITDWEATLELVSRGTASGERFDALVNCATADYRRRTNEPEVMQAYYERCISVNAQGSFHLFEAARRAGVPRVVQISSLTAVLGAPRPDALRLDTRDRPTDVYASTKIFTEHVGRSYVYNTRPGEPAMRVICLRLGQPLRKVTPDDRWHTRSEFRRLLLDRRDLAQAIRCALRVDVRYGVYPVVSANDVTYVDPATYAELGYSPAWKFTAEGVSPVQEDAVEEAITC